MPKRARPLLAAAAIALVAFAGASACGSSGPSPRHRAVGLLGTHAPRGVLTGAIRFEGGPALESRRKGGGLATVLNLRGHFVAGQHVRAGHDFRFGLSPGSYRLGFGRRGDQLRYGCPRNPIVVRSGRITRSDLVIGCTIR